MGLGHRCGSPTRRDPEEHPDDSAGWVVSKFGPRTNSPGRSCCYTLPLYRPKMATGRNGRLPDGSRIAATTVKSGVRSKSRCPVHLVLSPSKPLLWDSHHMRAEEAHQSPLCSQESVHCILDLHKLFIEHRLGVLTSSNLPHCRRAWRGDLNYQLRSRSV